MILIIQIGLLAAAVFFAARFFGILLSGPVADPEDAGNRAKKNIFKAFVLSVIAAILGAV